MNEPIDFAFDPCDLRFRLVSGRLAVGDDCQKVTDLMNPFGNTCMTKRGKNSSADSIATFCLPCQIIV